MLSCHPEPFAAFCHDLQIPGCEVHLYRGPKEFGAIASDARVAEAALTAMQDDNVYFLAGVAPGIRKRASDSDVIKRGMFTLDFDIRKELEKTMNKVERFDILRAADTILVEIAKIPLCQKFRYAVLSGNGLHLHYFGTPVDVVKEEWAAGMKYVFRTVNESVSIPCDTGCHNAGRIMRMPGSWNVKDPTERKAVDFLVWYQEELLDFSYIQRIGREEIEEAARMKAQEAAEFEASGKEASTVIALINQIPIEQVVRQLPLGITGVVEKKDGGLRFRDEAGVERGFFKHHQYNIVVHEGTSLFPSPAGTGYNCLGLVKTVLNVGTREAIQWFCDRSTPVREAAAKEKAEWVAAQASSEVAFIDSILPPK